MEHHHHEHCGHGHHHEECGCGHDHLEHKHEECSCSHEHHHRQVGGGETRIYTIDNLGCAHCAARMEEQIAALEGIEAAGITFATRQLRITARNPDRYLKKIQTIVSSIESQAVVVAYREHHHDHHHDHRSDRRETVEVLAGIALFATGLVVKRFSLVFFALGYLVLGSRILLEAGRNIRRGQVFDENFLMGIATLGAFVIREYPEAVGVMLFYRLGELFEHRAVERSRRQIMDAIDLRPEMVNRVENGQVHVVAPEAVCVGDILLIRPGDRIPLDGVITEGQSRLDTAPITGEPVPVAVHPGDKVLSGCVNQSGQLLLRVEKVLEESMVSRILDSVENAAASKPKIDRFITRFARVYTPVVVLLAAATAVVPSLVTGDWNYWVYTALSFLVMSCPCALVLSVPLAFFSGIGVASKKGILLKGGAAIEAMAQLKAVVLDKTGTITRGDFAVQKVVSLGNRTEAELLALCAGCEQHSTHPIAVSITGEAAKREIPLSRPDTLEEIAGHGISARMGDKTVLCGNRKLMEARGVAVGDIPEEHFGAEVFLAVDEKWEGYLLISDTVKDDAQSGIARLRAMGLHTAMLTGDSQSSAQAVASQTGIDTLWARLLPQEKLEKLHEIRSRWGSVMFVGDGINDAPVLAGADVGAAMGSGADAAIEAADAVFMTSSVEAIPEAIAIARRTKAIAVRNVVFALGVKGAVMALGLLGYANMWMAVFADSGVAMLCVLNSIRMLYKK